jgi:hypothetical protein
MGAAVLAATALAVSGCGGSSSKPLTRAELTAKANAICKTVTEKLSKKSVKSVQEVARIATELASSEQSSLTELSKLVPPTELESDWKAFVAGADKLAENTAKLGEDAKANQFKAAGGLITSSEKTERQMLEIAKRDGIKNCEHAS